MLQVSFKTVPSGYRADRRKAGEKQLFGKVPFVGGPSYTNKLYPKRAQTPGINASRTAHDSSIAHPSQSHFCVESSVSVEVFALVFRNVCRAAPFIKL